MAPASSAAAIHGSGMDRCEAGAGLASGAATWLAAADVSAQAKKFMVVMTDGQNTYQAYNNHNRSSYGAFAYAVKNRLGAN